MSFFGISFAGSNLSGDYYVNYQLLVLVEMPGHFFFIWTMKRFGRRITTCGGLLICGFACLAAGLVPNEPNVYQVTCSLIGKFFATGNFDVIFSFTSELFPTASRSSAVGLCSTFGRIGSILSPIIAHMGRDQGAEVPFIIFAIINIAVGLFCVILPETNNLPLPSTIQQAKDLSKNKSNCSKGRRTD